MTFREIAIEEIDFENETFRISEEIAPAPLLDSMREIGQLNPVVLLEGDPRYRIVCGFRRLSVLKQLNASAVHARIITGKSPDLRDVFDLALWDNLSHRNLEPLEKARALFKLKNDFGVSDTVLIQVYLPRMGLAPHEQTLRAQIILHESHPDFRRYFKEGRLTQSSMEGLAAMPSSSRDTIASAMQGMRLSASLQRKLFSLLEDLSAMTGAGPGDPLKDPQMLEVLNDARLSPAERGEKVYAILYRFRYPKVSQAEERFLEQRKSLGLPGSVRITADPYFETPDLRVEFTAHDAERFRKLAAELFEASRKPELDRLFRIV
jgi:hypothetical protein